MQKVKAEGLLFHHFWGEYCASIALWFENVACATDAAVVLDKWKISDKDNNVLVWHGESKDLDLIIDQLVEYGADRDKVASIRTSIDHGEQFEINVPIVAKEQLNFDFIKKRM